MRPWTEVGLDVCHKYVRLLVYDLSSRTYDGRSPKRGEVRPPRSPLLLSEMSTWRIASARGPDAGGAQGRLRHSDAKHPRQGGSTRQKAWQEVLGDVVTLQGRVAGSGRRC